MANYFDSLKRYFVGANMHTSDEWLADCIAWITGEKPNCSLEQLQMDATAQWLSFDLRELSVRCLPPGIASMNKVHLDGVFSVQVDFFLDISKSYFEQLQSIRNPVALLNYDYKEQSFSKRLLQVYMSDGVQDIVGMEHVVVKKLHANMPPGIKLLLKGPLEVRRGCVLLREHNVEVLGGEVEGLAVSNAMENVLARLLNLPMNPDPSKYNDQRLKQLYDMANTQIEPNGLPASGCFAPHRLPDNRNFNVSSVPRNNSFNNRTAPPPTAVVPLQPKLPVNIQFDDDEDLIIPDEVEMLLDGQTTNNSSLNTKPEFGESSSTVELFPEISLDYGHLEQLERSAPQKAKINSIFDLANQPFNFDMDKVECKSRMIVDKKKKKQQPLGVDIRKFFGKEEPKKQVCETVSVGEESSGNSSSSISKRFQQNIRDEFVNATPDNIEDFQLPCSSNLDDDDIFADIDVDAHLDGLELQMKDAEEKGLSKLHRPLPVEAKPFIHIKQLLDNRQKIKTGRYVVKAEFMKCTRKFQVNATDGYSMHFIINDGTGQIEASFKSSVLENIIEMSPEVMLSLKEQVKQGNTPIMDNLVELLRKMRNTLIEFDNLIHLEFNGAHNPPTITALEEMTADHVVQLERRIQ